MSKKSDNVFQPLDDLIDDFQPLKNSILDLINNHEERKQAKEKNNNENQKYTDDELRDDYGLTPEEIDKVQNEGYDPWDFEEEDQPNDDDYYSEDN